MSRVIVSALVLLLPLTAAAPGALGRDPSVFEMRRARESAPRRPVVHPAPPLDEGAREADRTTEHESGRRAEKFLREQRSAAVNRRPDLDYDVTSSIQQRNLLRLR